VKRSLRGLYVIRGGVAGTGLSSRAQTDPEPDATEPVGDGRLGTLEVHFSTFNTWYQIDSFWEGSFLERTVQGAFKRTIADRGSQVKVLFNHGMDLHIGDKVLSVPEVIEERADSPYLEGPLFDTSYNRDLLPGLRAGAYGSSFMFEVLDDSWTYEPPRSEHNPDGLPERTIREVRLHEAGPVTWPANPDATASLRSGMDWYADRLRERETERYDDLVRSLKAFRAMNNLGTPDVGPAGVVPDPEPKPKTPAPGIEPARHVDGMSAAARQRRLALIDMAKRQSHGLHPSRT
jgi:HK97 family phage prohead protease